MNHDQLALYNKLLVLYMLNRSAFPLTQAQIYDFLLEKNYVNFMNLQLAITELIDTGFVTAESRLNRTYLTITSEGRQETSVLTDYHKALSGDYEVRLSVKEKDAAIVELTMYVPNQEAAEMVCANWKKKNQSIYQYLTGQLF